jgi:cytochrome c553
MLNATVSRAIAACMLSSLVFASQGWAQGDSEAGKHKKQMCEGCHGIPDYRAAYPDVYRVPKLGGQNAAYLVKALQDYKSGARKHPTMHGIAATMTEQDMADLAAYYAGTEAAK